MDDSEMINILSRQLVALSAQIDAMLALIDSKMTKEEEQEFEETIRPKVFGSGPTEKE